MSDQAASPQSSAELFGSDRMWGLKELPLPEPVSWWPQTFGWYILAALLLLGLAWLGWRQWRHYQHNAYRREGLAKLEVMASDPTALRQLPYLLRKSALCAAPRADVAGLRSRDWISWLNESAGCELFAETDGEKLDALAYARDRQPLLNDTELQHLVDASKTWMRDHRASV
jgi:hypothetical protein